MVLIQHSQAMEMRDYSELESFASRNAYICCRVKKQISIQLKNIKSMSSNTEVYLK